MADPFSALYGEDPQAAQAAAQALAQAMARRRAASTVGAIVGGPFAGQAKQFSGEADNSADLLTKALQFRANAKTREDLMKIAHPGAAAKGQNLSLQGRVQFKVDPGTGETFFMDSDSGATYHADGTPRTGPIRVRPTATTSAPSAPSPSPAAPRLTGKTPPAPVQPVGEGIPTAGPPDYGVTPGASTGSVGQPLYGKVLQKGLSDLGNDFDPNKGTGEVASNQRRLNAALRLRALVTNPDGSVKTNIPPQFMKETAAALAQLVNAGGVPAQSLIEELTPKTGSSKVADIIQYITANPTDAGQGQFVKLYLESANREAEVARQALDKAVSARVGKHQRVIKGNPKESADLLKSYGWELDAQGNLKPVEEKPAPLAAAPSDQPPVPGAFKTKSGRWAVKNAQGQAEYVEGK